MTEIPSDSVDFHTHIYPEADLETASTLSDLDVERLARDYVDRLERRPIRHAVAIVMDDDMLFDPNSVDALRRVADDTGRFSLVFLVDPLRDDALQAIERAASVDALGIKLHPYLQDLVESTYSEIRSVLEAADDEGLLTIVDCSYGGEKMYDCNGVHLGHEMARSVDTPIVLAHGGGPRILDAFSSAVAHENVYLDASFSLSYWAESSVERDFAFAVREMDGEKWVWGSDAPYLAFDRALEDATGFLSEHELEAYSQAFFRDNARLLLS